ncbi:MAG: hypothetical protein F6K35_34330 [Okeania sp. SIO2H7]|nr:hypothetical protein [Okeania sp. SIO2H7]
MARQLAMEQPFYGLQAVGVNGESKPLTSIEDMAATYIKAIQTVQPQGPYQLGGWCLGGFVAFEMAQQLLSSGQKIKLLAMIQSFISATKLDEAEEVIRFARYLTHHFDKELVVSVDELQQLGLKDKLNYVFQKILKLLPLEISLERMGQLFAVFQAAGQVEEIYVPQPYSGQITFFYAEEPPEQLAEKQQQMQHWSSLAAGGINIHKIPGDHFSIIPSEALAKQLGLYLGC